MLKLTFTSAPFQYRLAADIPITGFPGAHYHPELITPPRIYGEEYDGGGVVALFLNEEALVDGYEVIYLQVSQNQVWWPSYNYTLYRWNATTGEYLGRVTSAGSAYLKIMAQDRDGTLWGLNATTSLRAFKYTIDPTTHDLITDGVAVFDFSGFAGVILMTGFCIDVDTNTLLAGINEDRYLRVFNLTTGALVRAIALPGVAVQIMPEDLNRCYVMTGLGMLCLVDYATGAVLSVFSVQTTFDPYSVQKSITWDRKYRRFLSWVYTPVDVTGQNTSVINGFFPLPQAVGMTRPIPIRPPRKYGTTPVLTRVYGDMGEAVGGARVVLTLPGGTTAAVVAGFPALTDADGESLGTIDNLDVGTVTLTATATVP